MSSTVSKIRSSHVNYLLCLLTTSLKLAWLHNNRNCAIWLAFPDQAEIRWFTHLHEHITTTYTGTCNNSLSRRVEWTKTLHQGQFPRSREGNTRAIDRCYPYQQCLVHNFSVGYLESHFSRLWVWYLSYALYPVSEKCTFMLPPHLMLWCLFSKLRESGKKKETTKKTPKTLGIFWNP